MTSPGAWAEMEPLFLVRCTVREPGDGHETFLTISHDTQTGLLHPNDSVRSPFMGLRFIHNPVEVGEYCNSIFHAMKGTRTQYRFRERESTSSLISA